MFSVTLALAVLLGAGVVAGRLAQAVRLPSVTGYIVAGLLVGPFGLGWIDEHTAGNDLGIFTHMALMLISFGIGEHLDLRSLRRSAKVISWMGMGESMGAFVLVGAGVAGCAWALSLGPEGWQTADYVILGLLLGAVAVATAPASTLHVTREAEAAGPLTNTLLPVVAVNNGVAIGLFGIVFAVSSHLVAGVEGAMWLMVLSSLGDAGLALVMGLVTGLVLDWVVHRLQRRSEMLTAGLALLLLCGEAARLMDLSPLLAGIAVGFTIVNRDRRDVRIFRAINDFEPPIYVLFFTLAGAHVDVSALGVAGGLALLYFLLRAGGKMAGAYIGGVIADAPKQLRRLLGMALLPQAGVAIGLVLLVEGDKNMDAFNDIITPLVLAAVLLAELVGPVATKAALVKAGEVGNAAPNGLAASEDQEPPESPSGVKGIRIFLWPWDPLQPAEKPESVVVFGLKHPDLAVGLARISTILSHHYQALPLGLHIHLSDSPVSLSQAAKDVEGLAQAAAKEVESIGYPLETRVVASDEVITGFLDTARALKPKAIVLGYMLDQDSESLAIAEALAEETICPVMVLRFGPALSTRRILVPVVSLAELTAVDDAVSAVSHTGMHVVTLLQNLSSEATDNEVRHAEEEMAAWAEESNLGQFVTCRAIAAESRSATILDQAKKHDLVIMAAHPAPTVQRIFFGSLAADVLARSKATVMLVHRPRPQED